MPKHRLWQRKNIEILYSRGVVYTEFFQNKSVENKNN